MKFYRAEVHGNIIEARLGDWGGEYVLLNGREISRRSILGWPRSPWHCFDIVDEDGRSRAVEVRWLDRSKIGVGPFRVVISIDGVERCRLDPMKSSADPGCCANCGYSLQGLPAENGEVRCPECGRHTTAALLSR